MKVTQAFCVTEQKDTDHVVTVKNGEIILTCACKSFVKYDAKLSNAQIKALIIRERMENRGRVLGQDMDAQKKADQERLDAFGD